MLCKNCGKNQATTHIKRVINGKVTEYHLCSECAAKMNMTAFNPFDMSDLWGSLFGGQLPSEAQTVHCSTCGSSFGEIAKRGKLGCPDCYKTFYDDLLPSLRRMHGKTHHVGKIPESADDDAKNAYHLKELKSQLAEAVENEEYEKCAQLRDEIRKIEAEEAQENE